MQIGIPRAMSYYNFFPFWFGFFEDLGIKVVLSDKTTKETMSKGSALVVTETCLPVRQIRKKSGALSVFERSCKGFWNNG